ncbi:hypothetical protein O3P69_018732 [Scylla paramamosain]|uniref:Aromatic-L-amino-acid decarboxylase n=1 Tax=Scylla paramamosain TaxID=85552 RepID=A0AAW0STI8_SCYPA
MEGEEFRQASKEITDFIISYLDNIRDRRVLPKVEPGYLRPLLPDAAPDTPDSWQDVMKDIERVIMPGVTHWHSPQFHAYFPTANTFPSILADMLSAAIGCIGFSWISSPACTELEVVMMDWLGEADWPASCVSGVLRWSRWRRDTGHSERGDTGGDAGSEGEGPRSDGREGQGN